MELRSLSIVLLLLAFATFSCDDDPRNGLEGLKRESKAALDELDKDLRQGRSEFFDFAGKKLNRISIRIEQLEDKFVIQEDSLEAGRHTRLDKLQDKQRQLNEELSQMQDQANKTGREKRRDFTNRLSTLEKKVNRLQAQ